MEDRRRWWLGIRIIVIQTDDALTIIVSNVNVEASANREWLSSQLHPQILLTLHIWIVNNLNCDAPSFTRINHKCLGSSYVVASTCNFKLPILVLLVALFSYIYCSLAFILSFSFTETFIVLSVYDLFVVGATRV